MAKKPKIGLITGITLFAGNTPVLEAPLNLLHILKNLNIAYLDLYDTFQEKEDFSNYYDEGYETWVGDIPYAKHYGVDAYLATPKGKFKHYSVVDDKTKFLGVID